MLKHHRITSLGILSVILLLYVIQSTYFSLVLNYDFMRADVLGYWQASLIWRTPFIYEHPPFYAFSIALLRFMTNNLLPPVLLMMLINIAALLISNAAIIGYLFNFGIELPFAGLSALLFTIWPFVGLNYTVVPYADMLAFALMILGLLMIKKSNYSLAGLFWGFGLITHKGLWPFIAILLVVDLFVKKEFFTKRKIIFYTLLIFPIFLLWVAGCLYHSSPAWLFQSSVQANTIFTGGRQFLDGLIGSFAIGGLVGVVKGMIVLFFVLLALISIFTSIILKYPYYEYSLAISVAVFLLFIFSSAETVWGPIRFSRLLIFPISFSLYQVLGKNKEKTIDKIFLIIFLLVLFFTQLFYGWYIARVFYA